MADGVRFILDKLAPLFRRLEDSKLFTKDEVRTIVKKTTDCEYVLKRRQLETSDFLGYLQYMIKLDKLIAARLLRIESKGKIAKEVTDIVQVVQTILDHHIIYIFDRSVRRFSDHVSLWTDYISFLQQKEANSTLNTVFGRVLSLHPKIEDFWLQASIHELESNSNAHAARVTLQRGLRTNKSSSKLWLRYFELEVWNALRSTERQKALELVENTELLVGAPLVVFNHAMLAIPNIEDVLVIFSSGQSIGNELLLESMERALLDKFGHSPEVWKHLATTKMASVLDSMGDNLSENDEEGDLARSVKSISVVSQAIKESVQVLNRGLDIVMSSNGNSDSDDNVAQYLLMTTACLEECVEKSEVALQEEVDWSIIWQSLAVNITTTDAKIAETAESNSSSTRKRKASTAAAAVLAKKPSNTEQHNTPLSSTSSAALHESVQLLSEAASSMVEMLEKCNISSSSKDHEQSCSFQYCLLQATRFRLFLFCSCSISSPLLAAATKLHQQDAAMAMVQSSVLISKLLAPMNKLADSTSVCNIQQCFLWVERTAPILFKDITTQYRYSSCGSNDVSKGSCSKTDNNFNLLQRINNWSKCVVLLVDELSSCRCPSSSANNQSIISSLRYRLLYNILPAIAPILTITEQGKSLLNKILSLMGTTSSSSSSSCNIKTMSDEEDDESSSSSIEAAQSDHTNKDITTTAVDVLRNIILNSLTLLNSSDRCYWLRFYLRFTQNPETASEDSDDEDDNKSLSCSLSLQFSKFATAYDWIIAKCVISKPHLFLSEDLITFYEYVLHTTQEKFLASSLTMPPSDGQHDQKQQQKLISALELSKATTAFAKQVAERAIEQGSPSSSLCWDILEQLQRREGDHKAASHTIWKRARSSSNN